MIKVRTANKAADLLFVRKGGERVEKEWRCKECDTLLGVERGARLHLRYKQAQYVVDGGDYNVIAVCRNGSTVNELNVSEELAQPVAANSQQE